MLKAFSWVVTANLARQLAFLAVNAVLFTRLSRPTFGALALAFGYMTVFAGLGEFGIRQIGWRDIARQPSEAARLAGACLTARTLTAVASIALYLLLAPVLWGSGLPLALYAGYAPAILVNQSTFDFPLFGLQRIDLHARYSVLAFAAYVAACLVLVTDDMHAWRVPVLFVFAMALLLLLEVRWLSRAVGRLRLRVSRAELARIMRASWPLGVGETVNRMALSYPVILLGALAGTESVGNYRIAEMGYSFAAQFGYMFASAGFTRLAHTFEHNRPGASSAVDRMLGVVFVAALIAGVAFSLLAPTLLTLLFDGITGETLLVTRILGVALVVAAPARFCRGLLASVDAQQTLMLINGGTLAVGLAGGWAATAAYGITGMAGSLVLIEIASLVVLIATVRRRVGAGVDVDGTATS